MAENKKHVNLIQAGLEDLAKITGEDVEKLAQQSLKDLEKLRQSGIPGAKQSADQHKKLIEDEK